MSESLRNQSNDTRVGRLLDHQTRRETAEKWMNRGMIATGTSFLVAMGSWATEQITEKVAVVTEIAKVSTGAAAAGFLVASAVEWVEGNRVHRLEQSLSDGEKAELLAVQSQSESQVSPLEAQTPPAAEL